MEIFKRLKTYFTELLDTWFADAWEQGDLFGGEQQRKSNFVESINPNALFLDIPNLSDD